jgi:branched-chain amino acid transport system ATP-binding protein
LAASEALLAVRDIHTYYGDSYVLHGLSLSLDAGRIVVILGRNGMGKTTLIRSIAGLTPPRRGEVVFAGRSFRGAPPYAIAQAGIAIVPQGRRIFNSLSVRENLALPVSALAGRCPAAEASDQRGHSMVRSRKHWDLDEVLAEFPQLAERLDSMGGSLSGGEQQMLAIGRALMANPALILMDEPSEGLSPKLVQRVEEIMRSLRAHGHSILLVEQNLALAMSVADSIYVISSGRFVFHGTPGQLSQAAEILDSHLGVASARTQ